MQLSKIVAAILISIVLLINTSYASSRYSQVVADENILKEIFNQNAIVLSNYITDTEYQQKLVKCNEIYDTSIFYDPWGNPYIITFNNNIFHVYSCGINKINEYGSGDDICNWKEIENGYYYKKYWNYVNLIMMYTIVTGIIYGIYLFYAASNLSKMQINGSLTNFETKWRSQKYMTISSLLLRAKDMVNNSLRGSLRLKWALLFLHLSIMFGISTYLFKMAFIFHTSATYVRSYAGEIITISFLLIGLILMRKNIGLHQDPDQHE